MNDGNVFFSRVRFSGQGDVNFSNAQFYRQTFHKGGSILFIAEFRNEGILDFRDVEFLKEGKADFSNAEFLGKGVVDFRGAKFSKSVLFLECKFETKIFFSYVSFLYPNEVRFESGDLSKVSFSNTDITRIRFGDNIKWGEDGFTIFEEELLLKKLKEHKENKLKDKSVKKEDESTKPLSLEGVLSVYRNLRENYEFRLRYDDAGKFFVKEMELKRKYRESPELSTSKQWINKLLRKNAISKDINAVTRNSIIKENNPLRKHISLTGLYYHFSTYGESILKPVLIGMIIVGLSTALWVIQNNPEGEPSVC